jgi:hypothetical protein
MRTPVAAAPLAALLFVAVCGPLTGAPRANAEEAPSNEETARKENIERLGKDLRRMASSPRAAEKKDEIRKALEALGVLGGPLAAKASLEALALEDEDVEKDAMKIVETARDKSLVAPLGALVEHRDYRRRFRLHALLAHALGVIADASALEPLTAMVQSEDAHVVAAAADALALFRTAPRGKRLEPVRRLIDVFESTWNLKMSIRPEDRVARDRAQKDWEVYGAACRKALQALTGQAQLTRPRQFRDWWNDNKKATNW